MKVPGKLGVNVRICGGSVGIVGAGARVGGANDCGSASQESPIRGSTSVGVPGPLPPRVCAKAGGRPRNDTVNTAAKVIRSAYPLRLREPSDEAVEVILKLSMACPPGQYFYSRGVKNPLTVLGFLNAAT